MFIDLALYFNLQLNIGGLELPVRSGLPSADTPPSMEALDKLEVIPGVSILVRVLPVTKVGIMYDTRRGGLIYEVLCLLITINRRTKTNTFCITFSLFYFIRAIFVCLGLWVICLSTTRRTKLNYSH